MTVLIKPEDRQRKRPRDGGVTVQIARAALATPGGGFFTMTEK